MNGHVAALVSTKRERGTLVFLCADLTVFLALIAATIYLRRQSPQWPHAFHFASGLMSFAITLFALSGSFSMVFATREHQKGSFLLTVRLLAATIAVWVSIAILLAMEWARLIFVSEVGLKSNPWGIPDFGSTYYVLTGFYALHLVTGLVYLTAVAAQPEKWDVGACALFVHFTTLFWLMIYVVVYLSGTDLQGI